MNEVAKTHKSIKKKYKTRLIVGDGNFSYTVSLLRKHEQDKPDLGKSITATEFKSEQELEIFYKNDKESNFIQNIAYLRSRGVTVLFGIDATILEKHFPQTLFDRIHFNFPFPTESGEDAQHLIADFFASAKSIQALGGRIHMALGHGKKGDAAGIEWMIGKTYNVLEASADQQYQFYKRRYFSSTRYGSYVHRVSMGNGRYAAIKAKGAETAAEYIFEKVDKHPNEIKEALHVKKGHIKGKSFTFFQNLSEVPTYHESSSYGSIGIFSQTPRTPHSQLPSSKESPLLSFLTEEEQTMNEKINYIRTLITEKKFRELSDTLDNTKLFNINFIIHDENHQEFDGMNYDRETTETIAWTLLHIAIKNNIPVEIIEKMIWSGADVNMPYDYLYHTKETTFQGFGGAASIPQETTNKEVLSPVEFACKNKNLGIAKKLVEYGGLFDEKKITKEYIDVLKKTQQECIAKLLIINQNLQQQKLLLETKAHIFEGLFCNSKNINNLSEKIAHLQAATRGFVARRAYHQHYLYLLESSGETAKTLISKRKFKEANELTEALTQADFVKVKKILEDHGVKEEQKASNLSGNSK